MDNRGCPIYSYGAVNWKFIKKYVYTMPFDRNNEIEEQVSRIMRLSEEVYELTVSRGMEMQAEPRNDLREPLCPECNFEVIMTYASNLCVVS